MLIEHGRGLAIKNRLPSVYRDTAYVEAGGLMSYGSRIRDIYRRVALTWTDPEGSEARRPAGGAADEVRAGDQSQDRQADRPDDSAEGAGPSGRVIQVRRQRCLNGAIVWFDNIARIGISLNSSLTCQGDRVMARVAELIRSQGSSEPVSG